jgi:hypothetical protein
VKNARKTHETLAVPISHTGRAPAAIAMCMVIYRRRRTVSVNFADTFIICHLSFYRPTPRVRDADAFFALRRAMCCCAELARAENNSPALNWKTNLFAPEREET